MCKEVFQNILCYCLSSFSSRPLHFRQAFQNILCYCLSGDAPWIDSPLIFQNILCYCLSLWFCKCWLIVNEISKHLMLLFIPEKIPTSKHSEYFKTSYVIVYPISGIYYPHRTVISKHLMLLFINDADYIFVRDEIISKHLMLLFICSIDSKRC